VPPDPCLLLRGWRETGEPERGKKGKGEGRGEVEGDLAHPKILVWHPYDFMSTTALACKPRVMSKMIR